MHRLLIVEDDLQQNNGLFQRIHQEYPKWDVCSAYSFEEAQNMIQQSVEENAPFSLFLLDIQLTKEQCDFGGFLLAEEIRREKMYYMTPILFLTSVSEKMGYALSKFHCYNYISKPYSFEEVIGEMRQMMLTGFMGEEMLYVTDTSRIQHRIVQKDICYIESKSHLIVLETIKGSVVSREITLSSIIQQLTADFVQCHKKFVVNIRHIDNYDRQNRLLQVGKHSIPISRTYKEVLENILMKKKN